MLSVAACLYILTLSLSSSPAISATLIYDAFLSGVPVGTAHIELTRTEHDYRIAGTAQAGGPAHLFSNWQSDFHAAGQINAGLPELRTYAYDERERKRQRVLWLQDGTVQQVKNDQVRATLPALSGTDVLTAFFMDPGCWPDRLLHTGRFNYQARGRPAKQPDSCLFRITDDDGDEVRVHVRFGTRHRLRIPITVSTRGPLRGSIRLRAEPAAGVLARAANP
jgi:hypothetical protein